jgi:uncharacterized protein YndB with AHSA1/START domain
MENSKSNTHDRELILSRTLDAPVELVWEVFTNPEHLAQWWGPDGFTNTITTMDLRPGGDWLLVMHGPDGTDYDNKSVFEEIIPFKKFVYRHLSYPNFTATIQFEKQGDKTLIIWHMLFDSVEVFIDTVKTYKADEGLKQNLVKLNQYLVNFKKA